MRDVAVLGANEIPFGVLAEKSLRQMVSEAVAGALQDAGIDRRAIQFIQVGNFAGPDFTDQNMVGAFVGSAVGLPDVPAFRVEGACASGGAALREAAFAIAHGRYDYVLVVGVEKMNTKESTAETMAIIVRGNDFELEQRVGISGPSGFALAATRHMHEYGTTREQMAAVAVKNYRHGFDNPIAHLRKEIPMEKVLGARMISWPFSLHDCSLVTDGAAAVVLGPAESAVNYQAQPVRILGSGVGMTSFSFAGKETVTSFGGTVRAAAEAYQQAGISAGDVDFAECHDCFTMTEIINIEDLGFVPKGEGGPATADGVTDLKGRIPVNMSGGLKSKGHPVGCTGVAQVVESVKQLRGQAGPRQVPDAEIGLTHVLGGPGSLAVVHLLGKGW